MLFLFFFWGVCGEISSINPLILVLAECDVSPILLASNGREREREIDFTFLESTSNFKNKYTIN